jgi:hypothetical protein
MRFKNKSEARAYIAGFFDGEGTVRLIFHRSGEKLGKISTRGISVYNTEKTLIEAFKDACELLDIDCKIHFSNPPSRQLRSEKPLWIGDITHQRNLKKFLEEIPFQSKPKQEKLREVLKTYQHNTWKWKDVPVKELNQKYHIEGLSMNKCAKYFDVNLVTIHRWLHKAKIPVKPKGVVY